MSAKTDYTSASQQRILKLLVALGGEEFTGQLPGELARRIGASASNVTRDLHNLKLAGLAEEMPDAPGRWRLGPKLVQIAIAHMSCRDRAQNRMNELNQRYTRLPQ
jgi:DNA-binding IclR family transcriptional regulator